MVGEAAGAAGAGSTALVLASPSGATGADATGRDVGIGPLDGDRIAAA